jgi:hypothetical protein
MMLRSNRLSGHCGRNPAQEMAGLLSFFGSTKE